MGRCWRCSRHGHEPAGLVESNPLEVLARRAGRHQLEVVMEGRHAHARPLRQVLRTERLGVLGMEVLQDPSYSAEVLVPVVQGPERPALLAAQDPIDDFADRLAVEQATVERALQTLKQPDDRPAQRLAHRGRRDAPPASGRLAARARPAPGGTTVVAAP